MRLGRPDTGWKDTIDLKEGERTRILVRFDNYPGKYVFHSHNLKHEDMATMASFEIVRPTLHLHLGDMSRRRVLRRHSDMSTKQAPSRASGTRLPERIARDCDHVIAAEVERPRRRRSNLTDADLEQVNEVLVRLTERLLLDAVRQRPALHAIVEPIFSPLLSQRKAMP